MIEITNLVKRYGSGELAIDDVSMTIEGNEVVAIIGPSGAGKSTLINCINRLVEPTEGKIYLDDREITSLNKSDLKKARRDIGMIFQEYGLVERLTVMENVLSGRLGYVSSWNAFRRNFPKKDVASAYQILEQVGMEEHENDRADELSGGQRQRVGIARAVIQEPKILLADEPTSSLDPETSRDVMELLLDVSRNRDIPVLINIHEVPLAVEFVDRIIGLNQGKVVFKGTPEDLDQQAKADIYGGRYEEEVFNEKTVDDDYAETDQDGLDDDDGGITPREV